MIYLGLKGDDTLKNYYSSQKVCKLLGVTAQTLRNWDANGKLKPHHKTPSGYRYYSIDQITRITTGHTENQIVVGYCRVSSRKQEDDLSRQVEAMHTYLLAKGKPFEIITDIGSGINYQKSGLQKLIKMITQNKVEQVVVLYKDRLLRFGFELVEYMASLHGCSIEIIDHTEKSEQQELVEDLVQIITVYGCKLQGKRANKAKAMVQNLLQGGDNNVISN